MVWEDLSKAEKIARLTQARMEMQTRPWPSDNPGMLSNIGQGVSNAFQGIKQGMANQGAMNAAYKTQADPMSGGYYTNMGNKAIQDVGKNWGSVKALEGANIRDFFQAPMAIPALGGALGTGAIMAGTAGAGLGLLGNWALRQYGSTLVMKQEADTAQQIARALEASQMNSSRDRAYSQDGTNTR